MTNSAPMMLNLGCVRVSNPVMMPRLVMMAEVAPKLNRVWRGLSVFFKSFDIVPYSTVT
jgi:hypothetical protein